VSLVLELYALAYLAIAAGGAVCWWRFGPNRSHRWAGPAEPRWLAARRLALCGRFGVTAACVGALLLYGILAAMGRTHDAVSALQFTISTFPACLLLYVIAGALDGPPSATAGAKAHPKVLGGAENVQYANRDWFQLIAGPAMLVGVTGFLVWISVVPALNVERLPPAVGLGLAGVFLLALPIHLGSAVVRAEIIGGRMRGHTVFGLRRFDYGLGQVQISYRTMMSPRRELLLVSHMGWWPLVFSSSATGFEPLSSILLGRVAP
jgi:hypothetical protein